MTKVASKIIAAIDLGTSRSACAISIQGRAEDEVIVITPTGSGACPSAKKTETAVLLEGNPPHNFVAFGKTACRRYISEAQGGDEPQRPTSGVSNILFRYFKTELCENRGFTSVDDPIATAESGETLPLLVVMTAVLQHLKEVVLAYVSSRVEVPPTVDDVAWAVTIPAIYDDFAKRFMRIAAHKAGIISAMDDDSQLRLCLEPEAACLAVSMREAPRLISAGSKIMILDCGGGTVDITTHTYESGSPLRLKEIALPTGGAWGSTCVDNQFIGWLQKLLGRDAFESVRRTSEFYNLMDEWEQGKIAFQGRENENVSLNMVSVLQELEFDAKTLKELLIVHNHDVAPALHVTGHKCYIHLPSPLVKSFFAPTIAKIATCLKNLKAQSALRGLKSVFLVGGFSSCPLVEAAARAELESEACSVIVALRPDVAIVRGAALFANNPLAFERKARLTYGVKCTNTYEPSNPEHIKRRSKSPSFNADGKEVIAVFSPHIKVGESIPSQGACPRRSYSPLLPHQTMVSFEILASHKKDIEFPDKDATFPLAEVRVQLNMTEDFNERGVEVEFIFGKTEFSINCFRKTTGEKVGNVELSLVQEVQETA